MMIMVFRGWKKEVVRESAGELVKGARAAAKEAWGRAGERAAWEKNLAFGGAKFVFARASQKGISTHGVHCVG